MRMRVWIMELGMIRPSVLRDDEIGTMIPAEDRHRDVGMSGKGLGSVEMRTRTTGRGNEVVGEVFASSERIASTSLRSPDWRRSQLKPTPRGR